MWCERIPSLTQTDDVEVGVSLCQFLEFLDQFNVKTISRKVSEEDERS